VSSEALAKEEGTGEEGVRSEALIKINWEN
jgi:hypothetical protein